jgi:hypothetical protein
LQFQMSEAPVRITERLENLRAPASARITGVSLEFQVLNEDLRPLTAEELSRVVFPTPVLRMRSGEVLDVVVEHRAPSPQGFSIADVAAAIARTEQEARPRSEWFGGVDIHHVFFEGLIWEEEAWTINWGS